jgi:hypothetical protein
MAKIYIGDIGFVMAVDTGMILTGATITNINVLLPSGLSVVWAASINPLIDTQLIYSTQAGDLPMAGIYELQSHVAVGAKNLLGDTSQFTVYKEFQ